MPIYEYECRECGYIFEKMVPLSDLHQTPACPDCARRNTRKKLSTFATRTDRPAAGSSCSTGSTGSRGRFA